MEQDSFTTCFKTCGTNSLVFTKRFKKLAKKESLSGSFKRGKKRCKKWCKNLISDEIEIPCCVLSKLIVIQLNFLFTLLVIASRLTTC